MYEWGKAVTGVTGMRDHAQPGNGLCAAYKVNATEPVAPTTAIFIMMDVAIAVRNVSGRRRWSKLAEWLR